MNEDSLISIPSALIIQQVGISLVYFIGVSIVTVGYFPGHGIRPQKTRNPAPIYFLILLSIFLTIIPVTFSGKFFDLWGSTYGASHAEGLSIQLVRRWVFLADIIFSALLITKTGGWKESAFTSVIFSIPAFAILLRDSIGDVVVYLMLISVLYAAGLYFGRQRQTEEGGRVPASRDVSLWVVGILMLILTTVIGVLTRPQIA